MPSCEGALAAVPRVAPSTNSSRFRKSCATWGATAGVPNKAAPTNSWLSCPHLRRLCTTRRATAAVPPFNTQASSILSAYHVLQVMYHLESYEDVLQLFQNYAHVIADNAQACVFVTIVWRYLDWAGLGWTSQQPPGMAVLCSVCCRRRSPHQLQPHALSAFNGRRAGGAMPRPPLHCCPRHAAGYPAALFG